LKTQVCDRLIQSLEDSAATTVVVDQTKAQLAEIESVSRRALAEIRATVGGLRTVELSDELAAARVVLADAGVALTVSGHVDQVAPQHRSTVAWVVREAVTNIIRHSRATQCTIELGRSEQAVLRVSDNGVGLGASTPGNGLIGLGERVDDAGLSMRVSSVEGTKIEVIASTSESSI